MSVPQMLRDPVRDALRICENVVIPEAEDAVALCFEDRGTCRVLFGAVLAAIGFDDQPRAVAGEVRDIVPDRHLPAKARLRERAAQERP